MGKGGLLESFHQRTEVFAFKEIEKKIRSLFKEIEKKIRTRFVGILEAEFESSILVIKGGRVNEN